MEYTQGGHPTPDTAFPCPPAQGEPPQDIFPPPDCPFPACHIDSLEQVLRAKQEWELTADSMPQLIFLLDRDHHILRSNRALEQWGLGSVADIVGRTLHEILHAECHDADCHLLNIRASSADNPAQDCVIAYQTDDPFLHRHLHLHFRFHRLPQRAGDGLVVAVISDISDIKQTEKLLHLSNSELERRIEERTGALMSTNLQLTQEIEQRRRAEEALEKSREEYRGLVETMNEGLAVLDRQGRISYVNKRLGEMLGYSREEIIGNSPLDFIADENRAALEQRMAIQVQTGLTNYVTYLIGKGGRKVWVKVSPSLLLDKEGKTVGRFAVITDVTEHVSAERVLRESAKEIEDLYDNAPCGYHSLDSSGVFARVNSTQSKWLGYTKDEMVGNMRLIDILTPTSVRHYERYFPRLKKTGHIRDLEFELVCKNGGILPVLLSATAVRDTEGKFVMSRATIYDITYHKKAEMALRESEQAKRLLTAQVMSAQEKERQRIASELHDGIGQTLSAIKFHVENAIRHLNENTIETSVQMFSDTIPKLQSAIEEVRRISMDLRPSILDDIGILATLTWFCREFQTIYESIRVQLKLDIRENDIPPPLKIAIFRIVQEAMNNCAKYGQADCMRVSLVDVGKAIELAVEDNGQGFDHGEVRAQNRSFSGGMGLVSMRERAEISGGILSIDSAKGKGTRMRVIWPCHETHAPALD